VRFEDLRKQITDALEAKKADEEREALRSIIDKRCESRELPVICSNIDIADFERQARKRKEIIEKYLQGNVETYNSIKNNTREGMIGYIAICCLIHEYSTKDILILCDEVAGLTYALKKDLENV
jgi:hypothetical protein